MREWDLEGAETQTATQKGLRLVSEKEHLSRPRTRKAGWIHSESIFWEQIPKVLPADPFPAEQDVQCHIP